MYLCPLCKNGEVVIKDVYFGEPESLPSNEYPDSFVCENCGLWACDEEDLDTFDNVSFIQSQDPDRTLLGECPVEHAAIPQDHVLLAILRELKAIHRAISKEEASE